MMIVAVLSKWKESSLFPEQRPLRDLFFHE
jgi:hypothetical protein